jgi:hypothetical protein
MPFINRDDSRMVPITHESYLIARTGTGRDFGFGHITKIKGKSSEEFVPMSEAAGAPGTNKGVTIAGANAKLANDVALGGVNLYGWDTFNTTYIETSWVGPVLQKYGFKASAQYTDQRSVGDELLGSINTNALGLSLTGSRNGRMLTLAYTHSDDGGVVRSPWGGAPLYNSMMLESFDRAGEKALRFGLSWHGEISGRHVWSGFASIVKGWGALDAGTRENLPDETEFDLTLDYKFAKTRLTSVLWVRFRGAYAELEDGTDQWNARAILNFPLRIL